eukprot:CAMPEP_0202691336 /NCGR_PEP_ID=MMETSP1385-20130828/6078_1 /ASSEMBLY_ACC=CAM_ASM_000861 /TAXON_ID=933848 /ORGANISM="Elphidium margaritaceum" /LENGTH=532 /DNA_ID=CAMNT_0049346727 /DNA_START=20 /DNA_END=1618 /DNA_ORIENTATION=-
MIACLTNVAAAMTGSLQSDDEKKDTTKVVYPFQDAKTWKLITDTFKIVQPPITPIKNASKQQLEQAPELKYLLRLFVTLGGHKKNGSHRFIQWLCNIRQLGTSGASASMDISKIGTNYELSDIENAQQIYDTFFTQTLPFLRQLILAMPETFAQPQTDADNDNDTDTDNKEDKSFIALHYMSENSNARCELSRGQIASLLACCWFGLPMYDLCTFQSELETDGTPAKLEMWIRYFDYVRQKGMHSDWFNRQKVTVWRRCLSAEQCAVLDAPALLQNTSELCEFTVHDEGGIEEQSCQLHADFANEYIGGGVLHGGNVQEEIRFTVSTECLIAKFLSPMAMLPNEAILMMGTQQFFDYAGYGSRFSFAGYRHKEEEMVFCAHRPDRLAASVIVGIDAVYYMQPRQQIEVPQLKREMVKAFVGFSISSAQDIGHDMDTVSTGNWGCGIFRGDPVLKAMLQWITVTVSQRKIAYYTYGDRRVCGGKLNQLVQAIAKKKVTVAQLWKVLSDPELPAMYRDGEKIEQVLRSKLKLSS